MRTVLKSVGCMAAAVALFLAGEAAAIPPASVCLVASVAGACVCPAETIVTTGGTFTVACTPTVPTTKACAAATWGSCVTLTNCGVGQYVSPIDGLPYSCTGACTPPPGAC